jgi:enamine deaminase RidA (YjgF/YER057c/UK114 family)
MATRKSISIEGLSHLTAIPVASRIGPLLVSSVIMPFDAGTRDVPEGIEAQYANLFRHIGEMLRAAGGDWQDVAKIEFWAASADARAACDRFWVDKFPDPASRPARHTHVGGSAHTVSASFMAYIDD